jgi:hypothetical protein
VRCRPLKAKASVTGAKESAPYLLRGDSADIHLSLRCITLTLGALDRLASIVCNVVPIAFRSFSDSLIRNDIPNDTD